MNTSVHRGSDKIMIRLPDGLRAKLKINAAKNRRSMNAEAVFYIEQGLAEGKLASGQA